MAKTDVVTVSVVLRRGASAPRVPGARFVKIHRGENDPELKRLYYAYVSAAKLRSVLPKIASDLAVESAKPIKPKGLIR